jgi:hypothetical protein
MYDYITQIKDLIMNKLIYILLLCIGILSTSVYGEVFTKNNQKIKYILKTDKAVNFQFKFSSPRDKCKVTFTVHNEDDKILIRDSHNMKKSEETFNLPVQSGEYYFKMFTHAGCKNKPFEFEYIKTIGNFEKEINNKTSSATIIAENTPIVGYLQQQQGYGKDVDYYKLNIATKGILNIMLSHENFDEKEWFYVELFNNNNKKLFKEKSLLNKKGITKSIELNKGQYFVKISTYQASQKVRGKEYILQYQITK